MNKPRITEVLSYLPQTIRCLVERAALGEWLEIEEIRLRAGVPLTLGIWGESCFVTPSGGITNHESDAYRVTKEEVQGAFMAVCENSVYAYLDEIRQGYVTIKGGHRVGICGKAVVEGEKITTFREVSSLNFRIAHEVLGLADPIMDAIVCGTEVVSTLIISPPQTGKTTLLRDVVRQVSNRGFKTGVADDRGELGAMYAGEPQNDVGAQTDIIDSAPKSEAILMLLRTMSPKVIISDEIACTQDVKALCQAGGTGVAVIATTHGKTLEDVKKRNLLMPLFREKIFRQAILLHRDFSLLDSAIRTEAMPL